MLSGLYLIINDCDIYIGFLWVIDLGVGLVFFIFMIHFSAFMQHKTTFNIYKKYYFVAVIFLFLLVGYSYFTSSMSDAMFNANLTKYWFFNINHIDYYSIILSHEVTELNLLKESYFVFNSFEFFIVNFSLFFGLISAILFYFLIQRIFNFLNFSQIIEHNSLSKIESSFFIRTQNYTMQQSTPQVVRVWSKKKSS